MPDKVPAQIEERLASLARLVGSTPMLEFSFRFRGRELRLFAKYESHNLTGSIKDRMALHILREAYSSGNIAPGDTIAEATSGNTGISFAALGRALGHPVRIFMPDWMSQERVLLIQSHDAVVIPISHEEGGFVGSIARADEFARDRTDVFLPHQFANESNIRAHREATGPEIIAQLDSVGLCPTAFVAGVGTGGTVMGVGQCLRERLPGTVRVHPIEPANSPTLRTGRREGEHRIQGISDEFVPQIVDLASLDPVIDVWDGDAIIMAQSLARTLGLGVGISSGANLLGALLLAHEGGPDSVVVTVLPDCNKKYLSTDLCRAEKLEPHYLCGEVEITGFRALAPR